jgi:hypothetical protein
MCQAIDGVAVRHARIAVPRPTISIRDSQAAAEAGKRFSLKLTPAGSSADLATVKCKVLDDLSGGQGGRRLCATLRLDKAK